ncbi:PEGA domain-containing protein [Myxococcaceae bacterium JPH2]|nr:PEGA domain-containing protein [Myxococcaceae bacterium JPH2]
MHAALSGWLVGLLAVGPAAAQPQHMTLRLVPQSLPAATGPRVTVVAVPLDPSAREDALRLSYWAEQALARSGRLEPVRMADALDADGAQSREAKAEEGAAAIKEGLHAYDELDTQKALQQFDKAVRAYEQSDLSRHFTELSHARVMKAASQVANGENKAAELEMRAVLAVDPRAQFSPNFFPPEEVSMVEKERKALLAANPSSFQIRSQPVPAEVYVDGVFRGVTPVAVTGLPLADHYVTLLAPGHALTQGRAREGEVSFTLQRLPAQTRVDALTQRVVKTPNGPDRDLALAELASLAGVPQVLALLVRGGPGTAPLDVTGLRLDAADGHNLAYGQGPVPRGDAMATGSQGLLTDLVAADAARVNGKPLKHFSGGASSGRRTAGYVLLATGAALLAGGIYFGLEASSKQDTFKRTPQVSPRAQDLKDTGKTYALVADVGLLAGLVSAGIGGYLSFTSGSSGTSSSKGSRASPPPARPAATPASSRSLSMPPPPKGTQTREPTPTPAPAAAPTPTKQLATPAAEPVAPARPAAESVAPAAAPDFEPVAPAETPAAPQPAPAPAPPPERPLTRREKALQERKRRLEEARLKREEAAQRRKEEAQRKKDELQRKKEEARLKREAAAQQKQDEVQRKQGDTQRKAEDEARLKREEEEKRKREEEEKRKREEPKKKPAIDEDDLRNY